MQTRSRSTSDAQAEFGTAATPALSLEKRREHPVAAAGWAMQDAPDEAPSLCCRRPARRHGVREATVEARHRREGAPRGWTVVGQPRAARRAPRALRRSSRFLAEGLRPAEAAAGGRGEPRARA